MSEIIVYSKKNCLACKLITSRLDQWNIKYREVFDHHYSAPTLQYIGNILTPPIPSSKLRKWIKSLS